MITLPDYIEETAETYHAFVRVSRNPAIHSWLKPVRGGIVMAIVDNPYGEGFAYYVAFDNGTSFDYAPLSDKPRIFKIQKANPITAITGAV